MASMRHLLVMTFGLLLVVAPMTLVGQVNGVNAGSRSPNHAFYRAIRLLPHTTRKIKPVRIAVIDMGFRTTHKSIRKYILQNPADLPGNQID